MCLNFWRFEPEVAYKTLAYKKKSVIEKVPVRHYDSRMISTNHLFSPGQLQVVHEKVQTQKEHYLNYRKFILDDDSDIFASGTSKATKASARAGRTSLASVGPPPFGSTFAQKSTMASIFAALQATQTPASAQTQVL